MSEAKKWVKKDPTRENVFWPTDELKKRAWVSDEAIYKKVVFALAVGLGLVAIGTIVFWLTRACLGTSTHPARAQESACGA